MATSQEQSVPLTTRPTPRPFLKWAGGKGQLLTQLAPLLPRRFGTYHEPFVGGGALFFNLRPIHATLTDINQELIDTYRVVRDQLDPLLDALRKHHYEREHYYEVRATDPLSLELPERAARTIFLNRTGFNGLYRVNRSNKFNVPFGRYKNPLICDEDNLRACSEALAGIEIDRRSYHTIIERAEPGDFVYFDPPYVPISSTASFTAYSADGFDWEDQSRLARVVDRLDSMGVLVMLSNSDVPRLRELYKDLRIEQVFASRNINSKARRRRRKVAEIVVRNY